MSKIQFVKTIVPKEQYLDRENIDSLYIIHFDPVEREDMDAYECVECSVPVDEYNTSEVQSAYEQWKDNMANKALSYAIRTKVSEIEKYDKSPNVNGLYVNGLLVPWSDEDKSSLNRSTRVSIRNSILIAKEEGMENTTLWLGSMEIEINCDKALRLLSALEMYAKACFNVTAVHKKAVSELKTIEEVETFDVTAGYPKQLEMDNLGVIK